MKKVFVMLLTLMICASAMPALAVAPSSEAPGISQSPRAEVKEWKYRNNNGVLQKRLWSVTYGRWLTDWMDA